MLKHLPKHLSVSQLKRYANIQTHSCCTAVPGGSCAVHVRAARPSDVSLEASARLHLASIDAADWHRKFAGWNPNVDEFAHSRQ